MEPSARLQGSCVIGEAIAAVGQCKRVGALG
jgi:hypothetical protein